MRGSRSAGPTSSSQAGLAATIRPSARGDQGRGNVDPRLEILRRQFAGQECENTRHGHAAEPDQEQDARTGHRAGLDRRVGRGGDRDQEQHRHGQRDGIDQRPALGQQIAFRSRVEIQAHSVRPSEHGRRACPQFRCPDMPPAQKLWRIMPEGSARVVNGGLPNGR
jgi:hypothetical protein